MSNDYCKSFCRQHSAGSVMTSSSVRSLQPCFCVGGVWGSGVLTCLCSGEPIVSQSLYGYEFDTFNHILQIISHKSSVALPDSPLAREHSGSPQQEEHATMNTNDTYLPVPDEEKNPDEDYANTRAKSKEFIVRHCIYVKHDSYSGYRWLDK